MPFELLVVTALAVIPMPVQISAALLLVVATASRYLRGRTWSEVATGGWSRAGIGAAAGLAALGLAVVIATPAIEMVSRRAIEWSTFPIVRGSGSGLFTVILVVGVSALALELALHGWLAERVLELSPGSPVLPVTIGAFAEAIVTPGDFAARLGAGLFGAGLAWMYIAGGRSVIAPLCARVTFAIGAVVLEALRLVG